MFWLGLLIRVVLGISAMRMVVAEGNEIEKWDGWGGGFLDWLTEKVFYSRDDIVSLVTRVP